MPNHSDYIVYVDESGDHGLQSIDPQYPVFVLAFCIFHKETYASSIAPAMQRFKFSHFGHDLVLLHERDIRKASGDFKILLEEQRRLQFVEDLNRLIEEAELTLIASCIQKEKLRARYSQPTNPYHLAMAFGLERVARFLSHRKQTAETTHVVFEKRGRREDQELELEFRRVCDGENYRRQRLPFEIVMADKRTNSCGLQLADLVARPIGRHILDPGQPNRAFDILKTKFDRGPTGAVEGYGIKRFP